MPVFIVILHVVQTGSAFLTDLLQIKYTAPDNANNKRLNIQSRKPTSASRMEAEF